MRDLRPSPKKGISTLFGSKTVNTKLANTFFLSSHEIRKYRREEGNIGAKNGTRHPSQLNARQMAANGGPTQIRNTQISSRECAWCCVFPSCKYTQHDATFLIASVKEFKCLHCLTCDVFCFLQDRYLFCSGAYDGKINVYDAKKCNLLGSYPVSLCFIRIIDQTHRQNERHCSSSAVTKNHRGVEKIILNVCLWGGGWAYHWLPFRRFHSKFQDGILKWRVWLWMMY